MAEDRLDDLADLVVSAVHRLERPARAGIGRGRNEIAPELVDEERRMLPVGEAEPNRVLPVEGAALAEDALRAGVVALADVAEVDVAGPALPVVVEARERARLLADVALRVAAAGAEREQLHQFAGVVLVRRPLRVFGAREPEQHRRSFVIS